VAAGLYSLGIFSPTNSASTSITGFSGLGSVQAECIGNQGLSMQIGNGLGYPIQLLNISVTGSGTTSSLQIQQTVSPNQYSQLYIPDICPSPSSRYSLSVTVFYTEPGQAFPGPYQSTGTIQGTPSTQSLSSSAVLISDVPITLTNNQNTSTPNPFQQMVTLPASVYSGYANLSGIHSFQNVEFFYSNGSVIHSWIENYTSSNVRYWIKIPSAPSYSSFTIYVGFASKTTNLLNTNNIGEAPQLSGTYGEYDDGANVFNVYSDFAGTSLPSSFTSYNGSNAYFSVNNCLQLQVNNAGCTGTWAGVIYDNSMDSTNSIVETYGSGTRSNGPDDVGVYTANSASGGGYAGVANGWGWGHGSIGGGYVGLGNPFDISSGSGVASIYWIGQGDEGIGWNYNFVSSTDTSMTWNSNLFASIQTGQCSPGADMNYYWFRIRTYPPNGVMPSISFGNVQ
jgi:hypothetical protein